MTKTYKVNISVEYEVHGAESKEQAEIWAEDTLRDQLHGGEYVNDMEIKVEEI